MVKNRDFIIAVLFAFCLAAMLFLVKPTVSQTSLNYNPFYDLNHDGVINMRDITLEARAFGGTGDPTENVNVTNWQQPQLSFQYSYYNLNTSIMGGYGSSNLVVFGINGYSRMFVNIEIEAASYEGVPITTTVYLNFVGWSQNQNQGLESVPSPGLSATYNGTSLSTFAAGNQQASPEISTELNSCYLYFYVISGVTTGWIAYQVTVYLRNE